MLRDASLSGSCTSDCWCFPSLALRKLYFHFLSKWMRYDRGDSFWTKWKFHLVQFERKWKYSLLSVGATIRLMIKMYEPKLLQQNEYIFQKIRWRCTHFFLSDAPEYQGMKTYKLNCMYSMILKQTVIVKLSVILLLRLSV